MKESKNKKTFDGKSGGSVGIGLALGLAIGLMMGVAMDNIPMWMCLGISIGLCCGTAFGVSGKGKQNSDNPDDEASKKKPRIAPGLSSFRSDPSDHSLRPPVSDRIIWNMLMKFR